MQPTSYTPVADPNATPTYGTSGPAVTSAQMAYNQNNSTGIQNGTIEPLAEDGKYGPKTQAALLGNRQMVNDSSNAMNGYATAGAALDQHLSQDTAATTAAKISAEGDKSNTDTYSDSYTQGLQGISDRSNASTKSMIANLQAQHTNAVNDIDQNYDKYTRGMELLGIENGSAQFTPEVLKGQLLEAKNQQLSKVTALDQKLNTAVMAAEAARDNKEFEVMKQQMDYVSQLKKDKAAAVKDLASADDQSMQKAKFFGDTIYNSIAGLKGDQKTAALTQLSTQLGIPVAYLLGAASTTAQARIKSAKSGKSGSGTSSSYSAKTAASNLNSGGTIGGTKYEGRGSDTYVDPNLYITMYNSYAQNLGQTAADKFLKDFPVATHINPASLDMVKTSIKKSGGSTSSTSKRTPK